MIATASIQVTNRRKKTLDIALAKVNEMTRKADKRKCLGCDRTVRKDERFTRGLCCSCYYMVWRAINSGEVQESDLIKAGRMLPARPGRKSNVTFLEEFKS